MRKNKLGFTLIELLAVVLIIGILASIAWPQYRRSISRAEAVEAMTNLRTLGDSARRYRAANGSFPLELRGMDVSFFDATSDTGPTFDIGKFQYKFTSTRIEACRLGGNYCFYWTYYDPYNTMEKDVLTCRKLSNGKYDWLCESLGKTPVYPGASEYLIDR